jgi:hypothetical protein
LGGSDTKESGAGNKVKKNTQIADAEKLAELLLKLVPHTKVLHHVPGEIKLQIMLSMLKSIPTSVFRALTTTLPGILDTRTSLIQRSVTIQYDEQQLPYDFWESLIRLNDKPDQKSQVTARIKEVLDKQYG